MSPEQILAAADQEQATSRAIFDSMVATWGSDFCIDFLMTSSNDAHGHLKEVKDPRLMLFYTATIAGAAMLIQKELESQAKGKR
jgi:hypothetical protein